MFIVVKPCNVDVIVTVAWFWFELTITKDGIIEEDAKQGKARTKSLPVVTSAFAVKIRILHIYASALSQTKPLIINGTIEASVQKRNV